MIGDEIETAELPSRLYRIGKEPDAWKRPPPNRGQKSPSNRYDDPLGIYHVIYAASDIYGACVEKFASFRPTPNPGLAGITNNELGLRSSSLPGHLHTSWFHGRHLGSARLQGTFVDMRSPKTMAFLRHRMASKFQELARRFQEFQGNDFDLSVLTSARREVTMEVSRCIFELETRESRWFDGICYPSRLGSHVTCWAIFDEEGDEDNSPCVVERTSASLDVNHLDVCRALNDFHITITDR